MVKYVRKVSEHVFERRLAKNTWYRSKMLIGNDNEFIYSISIPNVPIARGFIVRKWNFFKGKFQSGLSRKSKCRNFGK